MLILLYRLFRSRGEVGTPAIDFRLASMSARLWPRRATIRRAPQPVGARRHRQECWPTPRRGAPSRPPRRPTAALPTLPVPPAAAAISLTIQATCAPSCWSAAYDARAADHRRRAPGGGASGPLWFGHDRRHACGLLPLRVARRLPFLILAGATQHVARSDPDRVHARACTECPCLAPTPSPPQLWALSPVTRPSTGWNDGTPAWSAA